MELYKTSYVDSSKYGLTLVKLPPVCKHMPVY